MAKSRLNQLKTTTVTADYLNNLYDLFVTKKDSEEFKEQLIPLCHMVVQRFTDSSPYYRSKKEELFAQTYYKAFEFVLKKDKEDFDTPQAFNSYMIKSLYLSLMTYTTNQEKIIDDQDSFEEEAPEELDYDIRDNISYNMRQKKILRTFESLIKLYDSKPRRLLLYFLGLFLRREEISDEDDNIMYLESEFGIKASLIPTYIQLFQVIMNITLMLNLNEDFTLNTSGIMKQGNKKLLDKFVLIIASMEKYPFILEMYEVLGDKFIDFVKIFGGTQIKIPTLERLRKYDTFVEIFLQTKGKEDDLNLIKSFANEYRVNVSEIKYNNRFIQTKYEKLLEE